MQINPINKFNTQNFKAKKIAKAKNCYKGLTTYIDIYRINESDNGFLEKLLKSIDFKALFPKMTADKLKLYQDIFRAAIFNAMDPSNNAYLAVSNNLPCGLIALKPGKTMNFLDLVSIPVDVNKKVNITGQTLLYQAFLDSANSNATKIQLEALKNSVGNPVQKYKEWGMKEVSSGDKYIQMECDKSNITKQIERFSQKIQYKKVKKKNTNLESFLA